MTQWFIDKYYNSVYYSLLNAEIADGSRNVDK